MIENERERERAKGNEEEQKSVQVRLSGRENGIVLVSVFCILDATPAGERHSMPDERRHHQQMLPEKAERQNSGEDAIARTAKDVMKERCRSKMTVIDMVCLTFFHEYFPQ